MAGKIIMWIVTFGCAGLFYYIGVYAQRLEKPMWFWSGSTVSKEEITDVPAYNRANGKMWLAFSSLFWLDGIVAFWSGAAAGLLLFIVCIVGLSALVITYGKIYKKYANPNYLR